MTILKAVYLWKTIKIYRFNDLSVFFDIINRENRFFIKWTKAVVKACI